MQIFKILQKKQNLNFANFEMNFWLKFCDLKFAECCVSCRSRRELFKKYWIAKIGCNTAENGPSKVWQIDTSEVLDTWGKNDTWGIPGTWIWPPGLIYSPVKQSGAQMTRRGGWWVGMVFKGVGSFFLPNFRIFCKIPAVYLQNLPKFAFCF